MLDSVNELAGKVNEYQTNKDTNKEANWNSLKQILCLLGSLLKLVANDLPSKLKWLSSLLLIIAESLQFVCKNY
jgi:hypothetical protein